MNRCPLTLFIAALSLIVLVTSSVSAQGPLPPIPPIGDPRTPGEIKVPGPAGSTLFAEADTARLGPNAVAATGGPDVFGYTWDTAVAFSWIDATGGTNTGLTAQHQQTGPVALPFAFKYYENTYNQIYISSNGTLGFNTLLNQQSQQPTIPNPRLPNDVIAPHWAPEDPSTGGVFYAQGGVTPNQYFVVEWYQVRDYAVASRLTFEAILHENGDIQFQYQTMTYVSPQWSRTIGIEDSYGLDGLLYSRSNQTPGSAVRFSRPVASARMFVSPPIAGTFTTPGATEQFHVVVRNTGDLGSDTFDLSAVSSWPLAIYMADGVTPLPDTNGNGFADTGMIAPAASVTLTAQVQAPPLLNVGDAGNATLVFHSALDAGKTMTVNLAAASPAPFVLGFVDSSDYALSAYFVRPVAQAIKKATPDLYYGADPGILELPSGNFFYAWDVPYCPNVTCTFSITDVEFAVLNSAGGIVHSVTKLTDNSGATQPTWDFFPVMAATPNGRIGVMWLRQIQSNALFSISVFFAVLDSSGNLVVGPLKLTNNAGDFLYYPRIAATADNRFVIAWSRHDAGFSNVWYAVHDSEGNSIQGPVQLTTSNLSDLGSANRANANSVLLTWTDYADRDIHYAVVDSGGTITKTDTNLSTSGQARGSSDATLLPNGNIIVGWNNYGTINADFYQMAFAVLDGSYTRISGPTALPMPAAIGGNDYVSVVADQTGHAVIAWRDRDRLARRFYYALVDGSGSILTNPMILRASPVWFSGNKDTYGLTSYTQLPTSPLVDAWLSAPALVGGISGGAATVPVSLGNRGLTPAASAVLTATLDANLTYAGAVPPPTSVAGNQVMWALPALGFLSAGRIGLTVGVPGVAIGTTYPITWTLASAGPEAFPGNDSATTNVMVAAQTFLPLIRR